MISTKYLILVQTFLIAIVMTFIMSFAISIINLGFVDGFIHLWLHAWSMAFILAFPTMTIISPFLRKLAMRIASKSDVTNE